MKKRLLAVLLTAVTVMTFLTACNGKKSEKLDVEKLLSADYEVEYIFALAGLSADDTKRMTSADGRIYYPVQSDKYKTLADLEVLLKATYADEQTVADRLSRVDANGRPLYVDIEKQLYRSSRPIVGTAMPDADYDTIEKQKAAKGEDGRQEIGFSFDEHGGDGSEYRCTMVAVECKDGKWRLRTARSETPREVVKQGIGEEVADNVHVIAEAFVAALASGDTATIEKLTMAQGGAYSRLSGAGIVSAVIGKTVEELDSSGEYLIVLEVSGGDGTFPEGKNPYRMKVGYSDYDSVLTVRYLQPADFTPYDLLPPQEQTNTAANQVTYLVSLVGCVEFAAPAALPPEVITEYTLWLEEMKNGPDADGMKLSELQAQVKQYFGIDSFNPGTETIFYDTGADSYFMLGRGLPPFNMFVIPVSDGNGVAVVEVNSYDPAADPLMLKATSTTAYTLNNNWNDTYTFVSGVNR